MFIHYNVNHCMQETIVSTHCMVKNLSDQVFSSHPSVGSIRVYVTLFLSFSSVVLGPSAALKLFPWSPCLPYYVLNELQVLVKIAFSFPFFVLRLSLHCEF